MTNITYAVIYITHNVITMYVNNIHYLRYVTVIAYLIMISYVYLIFAVVTLLVFIY